MPRSANNSNNAYYVTSSGGGNNNNTNNSYRVLPDRSYTNARWSRYSLDTHSVLAGSRNHVRAFAEQPRDDAGVHVDIPAIDVAPKGTEGILSFDALWNSNEKCRRGVQWKDSVASFNINRIKRISNMVNRIESGLYDIDKCRYFEISYPKKRTIAACSYADRIIQRSLNDSYLVPLMFKSIIYDNCACQKGKGTDFALNRLAIHIRKFFRENGTHGYVLKCDIKEYYSSISLDVAIDAIKTEKNTELVRSILESNLTENGFSPGSQTVQTVGVMVLNRLDHYIKEKLHVKHYIRYMDDSIILCESKEQAQFIKSEISEQLSHIGLELNERKTSIRKITEPIEWLGFSYRLRDTGKVTYSISPKRMKSKKRQLARHYNKDPIGFDESYKSYRHHVMRGNGGSQIRNLDEYVRRIKCRRLKNQR